MITKKLRPVGISEFSENLFCFFGLLGLNFNAINLKTSQNVVEIVV